MKSNHEPGNAPGERLRKIITAFADITKAQKQHTPDPKLRAVERYLDDAALYRVQQLAEEGMRGFQA